MNGHRTSDHYGENGGCCTERRIFLKEEQKCVCVCVCVCIDSGGGREDSRQGEEQKSCHNNSHQSSSQSFLWTTTLWQEGSVST